MIQRRLVWFLTLALGLILALPLMAALDPQATVFAAQAHPSAWAGSTTCVQSPQINFRVDRSTIFKGECTILRWDVDNVQAVYLDDVGVVGHEAKQVCPAATTTYYLDVLTYGNTWDWRIVTVTVQPRPSPQISFTVNRSTITTGQCATLRWDVEYVKAVYLEGKGVAGHDSRQVCPSSTTTYSLRVVTYSGDEYRSVKVSVQEPSRDDSWLAVLGQPSGPMDPGENHLFSATFHNTGTTTWGSGYKWILVGGEPLGVSTSQSLPQTVGPGGSIGLELRLTAPAAPGSYESRWRLVNAKGTQFGDTATFTMLVSAKDDAEVTPGTHEASLPPRISGALHWTVRNSGTSYWGPGYHFAQVAGDELAGLTRVEFPASVPPGAKVPVTLTLTTPPWLGRYYMEWQMADPQGRRFGQVARLDVRVNEFPIPWLGINWDEEDLPVPVYLEWSVPTGWEEPIQAAIDAWNEGLYSDQLFSFEGRDSVPDDPRGVYITYWECDRFAECMADPEYDYSSPGQTYFWDAVQGWCKSPKCVSDSGRTIRAAKVQLRDSLAVLMGFPWSPPGCPKTRWLPCLGNTYVKSIVMHELGHAAGLGHTANTRDVMFPGDLSSEFESISDADRTSIESIYFWK